MGRQRLKWAQVKRYFDRHGYTIHWQGGDALIVAPATDSAGRTRNTVRIGHKCCNHGGDELFDCYVQAIRRAFGVNANDILND